MEISFGSLLNFLITPSFEGWLGALRFIFIGLSLFFLVGIVILAFKSNWLKYLILEDTAEFLSFKPYGVRKIVKVWNKILKRLETGLEPEYKLAVLEADSVLDNTLKRMGFKGETLGERLKNITSATLPNVEEIEKVHKTRNNIVHDPDYKFPLTEARETLGVYEQALRDLDLF